jgi:RHS repeat-associated protein
MADRVPCEVKMHRPSRIAVFAALMAMANSVAIAADVVYRDDFTGWSIRSAPAGWTETILTSPPGRRRAISTPAPAPLYRIANDPLRDGNAVFGIDRASGSDDGWQTGIIATQTTTVLPPSVDFTGRFLRSSDETRIGFTVFSSQPDAAQYYLAGTTAHGELALTSSAVSAPAGVTTAAFAPEPNVWYRFRMGAEDLGTAGTIRVKVWKDGEPEPPAWAIDAVDSDSARPRGSHIGIWSAGRGAFYVDDLVVTAPGATTTDTTPPTIAFFAGGKPLDPSKRALFGSDVAIEIRTFDVSTVTMSATLDSNAYKSLDTIALEGAHTLKVHAVDESGNAVDAQLSLVLDKTPPVVTLLERGVPFIATLFNRDVEPSVSIQDLTATRATSTLDGAPFALGPPIGAEGDHALAVHVEDEVGHAADIGPVRFTIDKTPPRIAFATPSAQQVVATAHLLATGDADDAVSVVVNGMPAAIDASHRFSAAVDLLEGSNTITAIAADRAGNQSSISVAVSVDTRAPELIVDAPVAGACLDAASVELHGRVTDSSVRSVTVLSGATSVDATLSADRRTWSATLPLPDERQYTIAVEAHDTVGHSSSAGVTITADRAKPQIAILESGAPFAAAAINRAVSLFMRVADADPNATVTATLDGQPYVAGTVIESERDHELKATARDCAGHVTEASASFVIDRTPPQIITMVPANGATVGVRPQITGTASPDAITISVEPNAKTIDVTNGAFSLTGVVVEEGGNEYFLTVADRAGNTSQMRYTVALKLGAPSVQITENGAAMAADALYNRIVTPVIRATEPNATIAATLNGAPFTSGTSIDADGRYTLAATASDSLGHSTSATVAFTIDRTPPQIAITTPAPNAVIASDHLEVHGTVAGADVAGVDVNGVAAAVADGAYVATIPVDIGPNIIVATARDRAGNSGAARVDVDRSGGPLAIILTAPADGMMTNRATTVVAGQILSPSADAHVSVGSSDTPVDATGAFRKTDFALAEGENTITASVRNAAGETNSATVRVIADRTPPRVRIFESNQPLQDQSRFADRAVITADSQDGAESLTPDLTIDGALATQPATIATAGGHTIVATARDRAGNETRVERTIFIGGAGTAVCRLEGFDPANGSVINATRVTVAGRSGNVAGVKVNGTPAEVTSGSFCATVELPVEGDNIISFVCTDASGNPTGDPVSITLRRVTNDPSIMIAAPTEGAFAGTELISVNGTVGAGVVSVDVNGTSATLTDSAFTATNVRLASGLNVIVARARNAAGRTISASRRVVYLKDVPSITITSPAAAVTTGAAHIDVSGLWLNIDPSTIAIAGAAVQTTPFSDTSGTFIARDVALTAGQQTVTVNGRDAIGRTATASVDVTVTPAFPSISIEEPLDDAFFGATAGDRVDVRGSFTAAAGSTIDIAGVSATVDANASTFSASVPFSATAVTPIVARLIEPGGAAAIDTVRVTKLSARPRILDGFPAGGAVEVEPGVLPLVLFSALMNRATTAAAFRLETSAGAVVPGVLRLDRDVLAFAPATLLTPGERYTIRVATTASDLGGNALESEYSTSFMVAGTAPGQPPAFTSVPAHLCAQQIAISGAAPPNARLRIDLGPLTFNTTASSTGAFSLQLPVSGQSGHQVVRARIIAGDGSLSPAAEACFVVDCEGPQVVAAAFDRTANRLTITFSKEINPATATSSSILLQLPDGRSVGSVVAVQTPANTVIVTPSEDLTQKTFRLTMTTAIADPAGATLAFPYTQEFAFDSDINPQPGSGAGFIAGEVFDADSGRPLAGASVTIDVPPSAFAASGAVESALASSSDGRGRYTASVPEGAHAIHIVAPGFIDAWRQIVVPPGAGVVPIDVRLAKEGVAQTIGAGDFVLSHAPAAMIGRVPVELRVPSGAVPSGKRVVLTSLSAQTLPGLLPLGWSPLAAATITGDAASLPASTLTFTVSSADISASGQKVTAAQYHDDRDEWTVLVPSVAVGSDGKASLSITTSGTFALVYPDRATGLASFPSPSTGAVLHAAVDPCASTTCPPLTAKSFTLDPEVIVPSGRTVGTLKIDGLPPSLFPSGTAVQAYIAEELRLADGSRVSDPPFTTDLLLYRNLAGDMGVAQFELAPSATASQVVLEVGFDTIRILPYPGRLDRGTLIGPEGGRVPGDGRVTVEIPSGATAESLHASTASIDDLSSFGTIAGFHVLAGFTLTLDRANPAAPAEGVTPQRVELLTPARATFGAVTAPLGAQLILAEVLDSTPFGRLFRFAAQMATIDGGRITTKTIDRSVLPVDGVVRDGRYLLLSADAPIAFATGGVRVNGGLYVGAARVTAPLLGVADISRISGIFNVPVPAKPAAPFTLVPRSVAGGDGATYTHTNAPDADAVIRIGDLPLVPQPPLLTGTTPVDGETNVALAPVVKATFSPAIDPASVNAASITVADATTQTRVDGAAAAEGASAVVWKLTPGTRLDPNHRYIVTIAPTIRGANGAPLVRTFVFSFTTVAQIVSGEVLPEKIRITLPDQSGHSRVIGDAGALPAGWQAVPVRRGRDFITRFQATAATDGSFAVTIDETVTLSDLIDLQAINTAGSIAAIIPLTPFSTEDARGFLAPADHPVTFTTRDGVTLSVEAGTFDTPTLITTAPAPQAEFAEVPHIDEELNYTTGIDLQFEGIAQKPIEVDVPVPPNTTTDGRLFLLTRLGSSARGSRMEIDDLLTVSNGKFTTREVVSGGGLRAKPLTTFSGQKVKDYLLRIVWGGRYSVTDIRVPSGSAVGWAAMDGLQATLDIFFNLYQSLYASNFYLTAKRGRIVVPALTNAPFTIEGVDAATGITSFTKAYDGIPPADVGTFTPVPSPMPNASGPYPVFGNPMFVQAIDLDVVDFDYAIVPGLSIKLPPTGGSAIATRTAGGPAKFGMLNVNQGVWQPVNALPTQPITAARGDRIVIFGLVDQVEPVRQIEVVFNESIAYNGDPTTLAPLIKLRKNEAPGTSLPVWTDVPVDYTVDSGARRVILTLRGELQRGGEYEVWLSSAITDVASPPLGLGQTASGGGGFDIELPFNIRKPKGELLGGPFALTQGTVRDLALDGNVLYVAATDGDLLAYDVSDPAALDKFPPISRASATDVDPPGYADIPGATWSVVVDHHGRIWTTALTNMFGVIRSYRSEKFVQPRPAGLPPKIRSVMPEANAIVSWAPGVDANMPLGTTFMTQSDRPEATPRRMQVAVQDESFDAVGGAGFAGAFASNILNATIASSSASGEFTVYNITVPKTTNLNYRYRWQRVTIENKTLGVRWSDDIKDGQTSVTIQNVLVRGGDQVRIYRNFATYGVVTLFGFGVGLYDLNAIEHNHRDPQPAKEVAEQLAATPGWIPADSLDPNPQVERLPPCDDAGAPVGFPCPPQRMTYAADATLLSSFDAAGRPKFFIYPVETKKGVARISSTPIPDSTEGTGSDDPSQLNPNPAGPLGSITKREADDATFTASFFGGCPNGPCYNDHPRLAMIRAAYTNGKRSLIGRFSSIARYDTEKSCIDPTTGASVPCTKSYGLIAGANFGILVLDLADPLGPESLADIIWVPAGAYGVRLVSGSHFATAVDGVGRSLLIDLSQIDERDSVLPVTACPGPKCLFPTVAKALASGPDPGNVRIFGSDDPRIIWKSDIPADADVFGTLAPVADPDTGFVFKGDLLTDKMRVFSGLDPHISLEVNLGGQKLEEVSAIVPLGIPLPSAINTRLTALPPCASTGPDVQGPTACRENASLGTFRVELSMPGSIRESTTWDPQIAIESERIPGVITEQSSDVLPRAHLRVLRPDGTVESRAVNAAAFTLARILGSTLPGAATLRFQKGYNRFTSPWIVSLADPRASQAYRWNGANHDDAGCFHCDFPTFLTGRTEGTDYFELYTTGRAITIRPELVAAGTTVFSGSRYDYLGDAKRLYARFGTVMADTVRPADALVAAQNAPVAGGQVQGTVYLHSGEVETGGVDLDAGGRAGWNVALGRAYRSRTIGGTTLGFGWDSNLLKRLRPLPTGDVEYRDGSGEVWLFKKNGAGFISPKGYFLRLFRTADGWSTIDQKRRVTYFDDYGRITREGDQFFTPDGKGNQIRYLYDAGGRLTTVIDPVDRSTKFQYYGAGASEGLLKQVDDWRGRTIKYEYDTGRLTKIELPKLTTTLGTTTTPVMQYSYDFGSGYSDRLELFTNLKTIRDPNNVAFGTGARVMFDYGPPRDAVVKQSWATGENVWFAYSSGPTPHVQTVTDAIGEARDYAYKLPVLPPGARKTDLYTIDRAHVETIREPNVETASFAIGTVPPSLDPTSVPATSTTRELLFTYTDEGQIDQARIAGARVTQYSYSTPSGGLPGKNVDCIGLGPDGSQPCTGAAFPDVVKFTYQYDGSFLKSSSANGLAVESPEAHRGTPTLRANNNQTTGTTTIDVAAGLPTSVETKGGYPAPKPGTFAKFDYPAAPPPDAWKRGLPTQSIVGKSSGSSVEMKTAYDYPSQDTNVTTDPRGVKTTTDYDEWRRPKHIRIEKSGDTLVAEEFFDYYPAGQIKEHRRKQDGRVVTTSYKYDAIGRRTETSTDQAAVGASTNAPLTETVDFTLFAQRTITTKSAGGSETTITLDSLGRPKEISTVPIAAGSNPTPLKSATAYDLAGNTVYRTDLLKSAVARAYNAAGRLRVALESDGTRTESDYDGWGRATEVRSLAAGGALQYKEKREYEAAGRLRNVDESGAGGESRVTNFAWDGGLRDVGIATHGSGAAVPDRVTVRQFDDAGRLLNEAYGAGTIGGLSSTVYATSVSGYGASYMPLNTTTNEPQSPIPNAFVSNFSFDTLGNATNFTLGGLQWTNKFNEAADVISWSAPGRPSSTAQYDSRGLVTSETRPDGAALAHQYHASGGSTQYKDETAEETNRATDSMGRPALVQFADGTTQEIKYDAQRIVAVKDRQNNWQSYQYNDKGQITAVWPAPVPGIGTPLDSMEYSDGTGLLTAWTNKDTRIEYGGFNFDGLPATTRQIRYRNATGFSTKDVLDDYTITHTWNGYGERTKMTMPGAPPAGWSTVLQFEYDATGNLKTLTRDGQTLLSAVFQNQGRPVSRAVKIRPTGCAAPSCEKTLLRSYQHDPSTGQMTEMSASIDGLVVAGSNVAYGNSLQVTDSQLLGVSANRRHSRFAYDQRSRVSASVSASSDGAVPPVPGTPGVSQQTQSPADFRAAEQREPRLDPATRSGLQSRGVDPNTVDPLGFTASESAAHKIASVIRGTSAAVHTYNGALRHEDGLFTYEYDEKERLIAVAEKPTATGTTIRRVAYVYDGNDRLVGRTAQNAVVTSLGGPFSWQTETRPDFLAADGLPAETTFVWDAVDDRLVSIFQASNPTPIKQIIHGDLFYDDPIEVTSDRGRLYPIFDEAATGSLQAAANINGEIVARNVSGDVYGGFEVELAGAAVDRVAIKAKKDQTGDITSIDVTLGVTEAIASATVAGGVRLASLDASDNVVRIATNTPSLADEHTVLWTFTKTEWDAFVASAAKVSIGVTPTLRAAAWSSTLPILPPPDWATASQPVFTSAALPVEVRESLASLSTFLAGIPAEGEDTTKVYEVADLSMLGTSGTDTLTEDLLTARFQALPFQEPFTALVYARARWYDTSTGTFITPDPLGYRDSSNMYGYCAGDPVNGRDPTGEGFWSDAGKTLVGYGKGLAQVVTAPGVLTYNLTGALLYQTTGGEQYREQFETSQYMVAAGAAALRSPGAAGKFLVQGFQSAVDQAVACANSGDVECTGEAVGVFVGQALTLAEGASSTNITIAPARQLATAGVGATIRAGGTAIAVTSPNAGVVSSILLSSAANAGGKRGGAEPVRMGQAGEEVGTEVSGLPKNTRRIPSASGRRAYRVPDHMDAAERHIQEDKATKKLHLGSQLRDDKAHVLRDGGPGSVDVLIDESTQITTSLLREHLNPGSPIKVRTGELKKP